MKNDWSIPCARFGIHDVVGNYLVKLDKDKTGQLIPVRDGEGNMLRSEAPVSGFLDPEGKVRTYGTLQSIAHEDNFIYVLFGTTALKEEIVEKELMDLDGVKTPESCSDRGCCSP